MLGFLPCDGLRDRVRTTELLGDHVAGHDHGDLDVAVARLLALARFVALAGFVGVSVLGIMKAAPHPNAARLFAIFRLSQEQQQLLPKVGMYPVIPGAGTPAGLEPIDKLKVHNVNADELAAQAGKIRSRWTKTRQL